MLSSDSHCWRHPRAERVRDRRVWIGWDRMTFGPSCLQWSRDYFLFGNIKGQQPRSSLVYSCCPFYLIKENSWTFLKTLSLSILAIRCMSQTDIHWLINIGALWVPTSSWRPFGSSSQIGIVACGTSWFHGCPIEWVNLSFRAAADRPLYLYLCFDLCLVCVWLCVGYYMAVTY